MVYAVPTHNSSGRVTGVEPDFCPRPLSRKKLKRLMPRAGKATTSLSMAMQYKRKPGKASRTARTLAKLTQNNPDLAQLLGEKVAK